MESTNTKHTYSYDIKKIVSTLMKDTDFRIRSTCAKKESIKLSGALSVLCRNNDGENTWCTGSRVVEDELALLTWIYHAKQMFPRSSRPSELWRQDLMSHMWISIALNCLHNRLVIHKSDIHACDVTRTALFRNNTSSIDRDPHRIVHALARIQVAASFILMWHCDVNTSLTILLSEIFLDAFPSHISTLLRKNMDEFGPYLPSVHGECARSVCAVYIDYSDLVSIRKVPASDTTPSVVVSSISSTPSRFFKSYIEMYAGFDYRRTEALGNLAKFLVLTIFVSAACGETIHLWVTPTTDEWIKTFHALRDVFGEALEEIDELLGERVNHDADLICSPDKIFQEIQEKIEKLSL